MLQEPENKVNEKQISKKTLNIQLNDIIQIYYSNINNIKA
jgi:hypothetical protein